MSQPLFEDDARLLGMPVEPYVGLTLEEAQARAEGESRQLRVVESLDGPRRADLAPARVNVQLDWAGTVAAADAG